MEFFHPLFLSRLEFLKVAFWALFFFWFSSTQGLSRRKAGNLKEVGLGWINGGRKDHRFGWRRYQMVVKSCFEDLEGRVGLKRVWEFVPKAGKKEE